MSSTRSLPPEIEPGALDDQTAARVEALIEEEEGAQNRYSGWLAHAATGLALAMALFHLWAAWDIVPTTSLRFIHVGFAMGLGFLLFPVAKRFRNRLMPWDVVLIAASLYVTWYLLYGGDLIGTEPLIDRYVFPETQDLIVGWVLILLVLEVTRRATGWVMPVVAGCFMLYAYFGNLLPPPWRHQGYDTERLIPHLTITLDGIFGTAVDVSASLIILFTIYGAILQLSGAGKFFVDFSFSATGGKATSAGRTVVLSSFLLGGPSGSGVATTVTLGTVAWPMMKRVGYTPHDAGGLLAAGGLGAIISPPVLGAAAFLIAEYLKIGYLEVLRMAAVPTILYYSSLLFMVELDQRRIGAAHLKAGTEREVITVESPWALTKKYGFHFSSLLAIVVFMVLGYSPTMAVLYAMAVAVVLSFLRRDSALWPRKLVAALASGAIQAVGIAATCACAGIIVGVITLTGLGLEILRDRHPGGRRQPRHHRALYRADRLDRGFGGAGDRQLHHLRRGRGAGADQARRARLRGAHVRLLLRGAVRGLAAHRAVALRRRRHHRRRALPDHAAGLEIHPAGLRAALRLRHRPRWRRPAAGLQAGHGLGRRGGADRPGRGRPRGALGGLPGLRPAGAGRLGTRGLRRRRAADDLPGAGRGLLRQRRAGTAPDRRGAGGGAAGAAMARAAAGRGLTGAAGNRNDGATLALVPGVTPMRHAIPATPRRADGRLR